MRKYFEGWYFKHQKEDKTLSLIPGRTAHNAFIQVITEKNSYYIPFSLSDYREGHIVKIKNNIFSKQGCRICIETTDLTLKGILRYSNLSPLKNDIMGFFRFLPMECRHSIASMKHNLSGTLTFNEETLDFNGGVGYM